MRPVAWIGYTTRYREGGPQLRRAATTLASSLQRDAEVHCVAVDSKRALAASLHATPPLDQLHLFSHSGLYGPMFGSKGLPEQFSPHEWRELPLRFTPGAEAWFHACRTGRWFAPFFARTFGVPAHGHHGYTTFSRDPETYRLARPGDAGPVFVVGQAGFKEAGVSGAVGKHAGWLPPRAMSRFLPGSDEGASYDGVAALYDAAFVDIRVRGPEWRWLSQRVPRGSRVLDVGCGTGALLRALGPRLGAGVGLDASGAMIDHARRRGGPGLRFEAVAGPRVPLPDASVDVVTSLLSWRYLDWDPLLAELVRVLRPGGRILVVDMVSRPAPVVDWPTVLRHKARNALHQAGFPAFRGARDRLVSDPAWQRMLHYNPIRAPHELTGFFRSRFPDSTAELLDVGRRTAVMAIDTGPIDARWVAPQSYP